MLLTRGADACCEDTCKRDPAYLAQKNGATECMQILALHNKERASSLAQQALEVWASWQYCRVNVLCFWVVLHVSKHDVDVDGFH